jgi:hypothetical protein
MVTRIAGWFKRRATSKARLARIQQEAREHARRSMECGLCFDPLALHERARGFCDSCWCLGPS